MQRKHVKSFINWKLPTAAARAAAYYDRFHLNGHHLGRRRRRRRQFEKKNKFHRV